MTIQERKDINSNTVFIEGPLYLYGIDSEEPQYTDSQNKEYCLGGYLNI